jgi:hypothetical protein
MSPPECTAAEVEIVLSASGFLISSPDPDNPGWRSTGLYSANLPMASPRVAVYFWPDSPAEERAAAVIGALQAVGYQAELVADHPRDYLAVWTEGEF